MADRGILDTGVNAVETAADGGKTAATKARLVFNILRKTKSDSDNESSVDLDDIEMKVRSIVHAGLEWESFQKIFAAVEVKEDEAGFSGTIDQWLQAACSIEVGVVNFDWISGIIEKLDGVKEVKFLGLIA